MCSIDYGTWINFKSSNNLSVEKKYFSKIIMSPFLGACWLLKYAVYTMLYDSWIRDKMIPSQRFLFITVVSPLQLYTHQEMYRCELVNKKPLIPVYTVFTQQTMSLVRVISPCQRHAIYISTSSRNISGNKRRNKHVPVGQNAE